MRGATIGAAVAGLLATAASFAAAESNATTGAELKELVAAETRTDEESPAQTETTAQRVRPLQPGETVLPLEQSDGDSPKENVAEVQQLLNELGYDAGPEDGLLGPKTSSAICEFWQDYGEGTCPDAWQARQPDSDLYRRLLLESVRRLAADSREEERGRLLSLSDADLIAEIKSADQDEARRIIDLVPERAQDLPAEIVYDKLGLGENCIQLPYIALRGLQYPASEEGIEQFQQDSGFAVTGRLTLREIEELTRRYTRVHDTRVHPLGGFGDELFIYRGADFVSAEGTWILEGDEIAFPINTSQINCSLADNECLVIQANIWIPSLGEADDSYSLDLSSNTYTIVSWTDNEVVARSRSACRTMILTINSAAREVYEITRNNSDAESCGTFDTPWLEAPRIATLVPGWQRADEWWKERKKEASEYINPRFIDGLEDALVPNAGRSSNVD